ncbi:sugar transferase [Neptuniibacter pectenicola]|uniref:sugar transferase n=1 Tax=Neptuniibacter pectenicola TaxID=1806669 RepID=UPI0022B23CDF|nr:sugar transferase [Neptuniibacter pectenicola]
MKVYCFFRRFLDVVIALSLMVLLAPVLMVTALFIRVKLGSPILFCQLRPGLKGSPFKMYKFRTMLDQCDEAGVALSDDQRLTQFGKTLRSTSLDELPELYNVLKGDMSLIGPRPLLMEYLPLYNEKQKRRHDVRPGITGWAQVHGRNNLSWEEKFNYDVWYVDNYSFKVDIKIILLSIKAVLSREGVSAEGHVTVKKFMGNEK